MHESVFGYIALTLVAVGFVVDAVFFFGLLYSYRKK
jgi:hypothetical protein